jgi:hypothetical protein
MEIEMDSREFLEHLVDANVPAEVNEFKVSIVADGKDCDWKFSRAASGDWTVSDQFGVLFELGLSPTVETEERKLFFWAEKDNLQVMTWRISFYVPIDPAYPVTGVVWRSLDAKMWEQGDEGINMKMFRVVE